MSLAGSTWDRALYQWGLHEFQAVHVQTKVNHLVSKELGSELVTGVGKAAHRCGESSVSSAMHYRLGENLLQCSSTGNADWVSNTALRFIKNVHSQHPCSAGLGFSGRAGHGGLKK